MEGTLSQQRYKSCNHIWAYSDSETIEADSSIDYSDFHGSLGPSWLSALTIVANSDYIASCPQSLVLSLQELLGLGYRELSSFKSQIKVHVATRLGLTNSGSAWILEQLLAVAGNNK